MRAVSFRLPVKEGMPDELGVWSGGMRHERHHAASRAPGENGGGAGARFCGFRRAFGGVRRGRRQRHERPRLHVRRMRPDGERAHEDDPSVAGL
jgi:hypothetical protein